MVGEKVEEGFKIVRERGRYDGIIDRNFLFLFLLWVRK